MSGIQGNTAWNAARLRLPHNARKVNDGDWAGFWENASRDYGQHTSVNGTLEKDIVRYLTNEGTFRPGDTVLDVGCGPGTYALLFAVSAKTVYGLDMSAGMLERLRLEAERSGITNVRAIRSKWDEFVPPGRYDLIFSSFCPVVNDPDALLKMERCSRRSCCYVSVGDGLSPQPLYQLWEQLTGDRYSNEGYDVSYPMNFLRETGRNATVKYFASPTSTEMPSGKAIDYYVAYFGMFLDVDEAMKNTIRAFVGERSEGDVYCITSTRTIGVICWDIVPGGL